MKNLTLSVLLMSMSVGLAHASEASDELMNRTAFESRLARAEVNDDFMRARAEGTLPDTSEAGAMHAPVFAGNGSAAPRLTRAQVTADYLQARAEGTLVDTSEAGSMHAPAFAGLRQERPVIYAEGVATAHVGESE